MKSYTVLELRKINYMTERDYDDKILIGHFSDKISALKCAIDITMLRAIRLNVDKMDILENIFPGSEFEVFNIKNDEYQFMYYDSDGDYFDEEQTPEIKETSKPNLKITKNVYNPSKYNYNSNGYICFKKNTVIFSEDYLNKLSESELENILNKLTNLRYKLYQDNFSLNLGNSYTGDPLPCFIVENELKTYKRYETKIPLFEESVGFS